MILNFVPIVGPLSSNIWGGVCAKQDGAKPALTPTRHATASRILTSRLFMKHHRQGTRTHSTRTHSTWMSIHQYTTTPPYRNLVASGDRRTRAMPLASCEKNLHSNTNDHCVRGSKNVVVPEIVGRGTRPSANHTTDSSLSTQAVGPDPANRCVISLQSHRKRCFPARRQDHPAS